MYENAVIKKFETSQIEVISTEIHNITGKTVVLYILTFVIPFGILYGYFSTFHTPEAGELSNFLFCIIFSIVMGVMLTGMSYLADIWKQVIPSYRVHLKGISGTHFDRSFYEIPDIYITKTTPEQDQIKICKAAQNLEPYAEEYDKKQATIRKIAENCK